MKATITSIELRGPLQFFVLSSKAFSIIRQLKSTDCKSFKKKGYWTKHYTMTLWNNEEELKSFASSGPHLQAMKTSSRIAKEIRTITIDAEKLPSWAEAMELLKQANTIQY